MICGALIFHLRPDCRWQHRSDIPRPQSQSGVPHRVTKVLRSTAWPVVGTKTFQPKRKQEALQIVNCPSPRKLSLDSIRRIPNSTIWNLIRKATAGTDRPVFQFKWGECSHAPGPIPSQAALRCHLNVRDRSTLLFTTRKAVSNPTDRSVAPPNTWFMSDVVVPLYRRKIPEGMQSTVSANPIFSCMLSAATLRCFPF
jgi:hypothetical protein